MCSTESSYLHSTTSLSSVQHCSASTKRCVGQRPKDTLDGDTWHRSCNVDSRNTKPPYYIYMSNIDF